MPHRSDLFTRMQVAPPSPRWLSAHCAVTARYVEHKRTRRITSAWFIACHVALQPHEWHQLAALVDPLVARRSARDLRQHDTTR